MDKKMQTTAEWIRCGINIVCAMVILLVRISLAPY